MELSFAFGAPEDINTSTKIIPPEKYNSEQDTFKE